MRRVERMADQDRVRALGIERAVGLVDELEPGQRRARLQRERLVERRALRRDDADRSAVVATHVDIVRAEAWIRTRQKTKTRPACANRVGWNLAALAGFITRPQADSQIGASLRVRRQTGALSTAAWRRQGAQALSLSSMRGDLFRIVAAAHAVDHRPRCRHVARQHALLDREQVRGMHREMAQTHAEQQAREAQLARHFAAHGDRHARPWSRSSMAIAISFSTAGCSGS